MGFRVAGVLLLSGRMRGVGCEMTVFVVIPNFRRPVGPFATELFCIGVDVAVRYRVLGLNLPLLRPQDFDLWQSTLRAGCPVVRLLVGL